MLPSRRRRSCTGGCACDGASIPSAFSISSHAPALSSVLHSSGAGAGSELGLGSGSSGAGDGCVELAAGVSEVRPSVRSMSSHAPASPIALQRSAAGVGSASGSDDRLESDWGAGGSRCGDSASPAISPTSDHAPAVSNALCSSSRPGPVAVATGAAVAAVLAGSSGPAGPILVGDAAGSGACFGVAKASSGSASSRGGGHHLAGAAGLASSDSSARRGSKLSDESSAASIGRQGLPNGPREMQGGPPAALRAACADATRWRNAATQRPNSSIFRATRSNVTRSCTGRRPPASCCGVGGSTPRSTSEMERCACSLSPL